MTSKESLNEIKNWVEYITRLDYVDPIVRGEVKELLYNAYHKTTPEFEIIEKDLEILDFFKKLFIDIMPIRLTDLQGEKYFAIPTSDIRRPDMLLPITEKEYELLKEWFRSNLLKEWLENDR